MKSTVSQESPTTVRVSVEATPEELEPAVDRAFRILQNSIFGAVSGGSSVNMRGT